MRKTKDTLTYLVLLELGDEISNIDKFLDLALKEKPLAFSNKNDILKYSQNVTQHLTYDELMEIKYYTGFSYGKINSLKRGVWDYDKLGMQTKEIKQEYEEAGKNLEKIISKVEPLPTNMVTYRGCDLKCFWRFGIHSLEELSELKGTYIYDNAFISTSLLPEKCFFKENIPEYNNNNIFIEYLILKDSTDGIFVPSSYYDYETEYLLNCGSFSKIIDVQVDSEKQTAHLKMVLVPRKVWNRDYLQEEKRSL